MKANAEEALFDKFWDEDGDLYRKAPGDMNACITGILSHYTVILAHISGMGMGIAASVAASFRSTLGQIKLAPIVGNCDEETGYIFKGCRKFLELWQLVICWRFKGPDI